MRQYILGVPFDSVTKNDLRDRVSGFMQKKEQSFIVTPNPEFIVRAQKDREFMRILNYADWSVADGAGVVIASRFMKKPLPERITGSDVVDILCEIAQKHSLSVFLFGGDGGRGLLASERLKKKFQGLTIAGVIDGEALGDFKNPNPKIIEKVNSSGASVLIAGLHFGEQEKFIYYNLKHMPGIRVAVGVGGVIDYLSGQTRRAPEWMRRLGMEWLFRLMTQPKRLPRIFRAVIVFPFLLMFKRRE